MCSSARRGTLPSSASAQCSRSRKVHPIRSECRLGRANSCDCRVEGGTRSSLSNGTEIKVLVTAGGGGFGGAIRSIKFQFALASVVGHLNRLVVLDGTLQDEPG